MISVAVIGMGLSPADLTAVHLEIIRSADLLVGGARLMAHFPDIPAETLEIRGRLTAVIDAIREAMETKRVVVLASGDPLFYGIGALLIRSLGRDRVRVYPNITSVAAAFARIGEPWGTVLVVSLHGREGEGPLQAALMESETVAVLTDPIRTPARLADHLMVGGHPDLSMAVLERLGTPDERVRWMSPEEAAEYILKGILARKRFYCFPWLFGLGVRYLKWLPASLFDSYMTRWAKTIPDLEY